MAALTYTRSKIKKSATGFIMLELMVAIVVASVSVFAFIQGFMLSLGAYRHANNYLQAVMLVENNLNCAQLNLSPLHAGATTLNNCSYYIRQEKQSTGDNRINRFNIAVSWQERSLDKKIDFTAVFLNKDYIY